MTDQPHLALDLRSDAITLPTEEMWSAMRAATLGWAHIGEDETVQELEAEAAALAGKEAGLLMQTGSLGNLLALMSHGERGDQVVLDALSHIAWSEEWGVAYVCGLFPRLVASSRGRMAPDEVAEALDTRILGHRPRTALLCLESSHNFAGGAALGLDDFHAIVDLARTHGVPVHLDGARLFNSCAALGEDPRAAMAPFDTVVLNLNKGLSAPGGAVLVGSRELIREARVNMRRVGGSPGHQAGLLAAAGLVALRTMIPQVALDNARARELSRRLNAVEGVSVDESLVETNIVLLQVPDARTIATALEARGLRTLALSDDTLRLVTHRHVTDEAVETAPRLLEEALACSTR